MKLVFAYLAGAIDADGYVTIQRTIKNVRGNKGPSTYYFPKVGLSETNPIIPALLRRTFGGSIYEHRPRNPAHKKWYVWSAGEQKSAVILRKLIPFLRLKRKQARLAMKLAEMTKRQWVKIKATQIPPYRITPRMQRQRRALWEAVTGLNDPRNRRVHFADIP